MKPVAHAHALSDPAAYVGCARLCGLWRTLTVGITAHSPPAPPATLKAAHVLGYPTAAPLGAPGTMGVNPSLIDRTHTLTSPDLGRCVRPAACRARVCLCAYLSVCCGHRSSFASLAYAMPPSLGGGMGAPAAAVAVAAARGLASTSSSSSSLVGVSSHRPAERRLSSLDRYEESVSDELLLGGSGAGDYDYDDDSPDAAEGAESKGEDADLWSLDAAAAAAAVATSDAGASAHATYVPPRDVDSAAWGVSLRAQGGARIKGAVAGAVRSGARGADGSRAAIRRRSSHLHQ
jgi:hypothetical protein